MHECAQKGCLVLSCLYTIINVYKCLAPSLLRELLDQQNLFADSWISLHYVSSVNYIIFWRLDDLKALLNKPSQVVNSKIIG